MDISPQRSMVHVFLIMTLAGRDFICETDHVSTRSKRLGHDILYSIKNILEKIPFPFNISQTLDLI